LWLAIEAEFERQQPPMTVRQVFYRMSAAGVVPKTENGYRQVQYALVAMRQRGVIPYEWIADNTRWVRKPRTYSSLQDMLRESQALYRRALWSEQDAYVEVWLEKDALAGVVFPITEQWDVPLYVTRGYPSRTYLYNAAEALRGIRKPKFIYHFGDYDASGVDAARAIEQGLRQFGADFHFQRVAVTPEQVAEYGLQTRPAKRSDPRAARFGAEAVELDAMPPAILRGLVAQCITRHIDWQALERLRVVEMAERATLADVADILAGAWDGAEGDD
jgi:hypothetical protein